MRFEDILSRYQKKEITTTEAGDLLGISERTFLRRRIRMQEEGFDGRFDKRIGKRSPRRAQESEVRFITKLYEEKYSGFSVKHFHEFAQREHNLKYGYSWCKKTLIEAGVIKPSKQGGPHRRRRDRKPMAGMMLHQDGSTHAWIESLGYNIDLIVTMDDATSFITSAFFMLQEGTESSLQGIQETIQNYGLFCSLYTDRGSHYFVTPEAGGKVDKWNLTQVGRALKQLGIKHIPAYSPEARGRSERTFGTLQNRLPKELALNGITTIEAANDFLKTDFIPRYNQQFSVAAADATPAYIQWTGSALEEILCIKDERIVNKDNTVSYGGLLLQIPKNEHRHHYVKMHVEVRKYLDQTLAIFCGHLCLGRYDSQGVLLRQQLDNYAS